VLLAALLAASSAAHASSELLVVSKEATQCKAPNDCGYNNPSIRVDCSFQSGGVVLMSKVAIASMVGPVVPVPVLNGALSSDDLVELKLLAQQLTANPAKMTGVLPSRAYSFNGSQYAALENYKLSTAEGPLFVALVFSSGGQIMESPAAARLVTIADKYCSSPL
jgi:hypothetical protein